MKHDFLKKALAGILAIVLVSGAVPVIPVQKNFTSPCITAHALQGGKEQTNANEYLDENGKVTAIPANAVSLTGTESSDYKNPLPAGTYVVDKDITFSKSLHFSGDVKLILKDGCTMTVGTEENPISGCGITILDNNDTSSLTIYAQSDSTGTLSVNSKQQCIFCYTSSSQTSYAQYGGTVSLNSLNDNGILFRGAISVKNATMNISSVNMAIQGNNDITIEDSNININNTGSYYGIFSNEGTISITGGKVNVSSNGIAIQGNTGVTITDSDVTAKSTKGYGIFSINAISITDSNVTANSKESIGIYSVKEISITDSNVTTNSEESNGIWGNAVSITGGMVDISSKNYAISSNNVSITDSGITVNSKGYGIYNYNGEISIEDSDITVNSEKYGIYNYRGEISITGGTLDISSKYDAIHGNTGVTITDSDITANSEIYGIYTPNGKISITGGTLDISSKNMAIYDGTNDVTITDSDVTANSAESYGIYSDNFITENSIVNISSKYDAIYGNTGVTITDSDVTANSESYGINSPKELSITGGKTVTNSMTCETAIIDLPLDSNGNSTGDYIYSGSYTGNVTVKGNLYASSDNALSGENVNPEDIAGKVITNFIGDSYIDENGDAKPISNLLADGEKLNIITSNENFTQIITGADGEELNTNISNEIPNASGTYLITGEVNFTELVANEIDNITLILANDCDFKLESILGIQNLSLTIYGQAGNFGKLTTKNICCNSYAQYSGTVDITSDDASALKCDNNITIGGGILKAEAKNYHGIYSGGDMEISGGKVTASSTDDGSNGIYNVGALTISGGKVTATSTSDGSNGILSSGDMVISGGKVTVSTTGDRSNGIYNVGALTISGGKVTASAESNGIYSGGGMEISGGNVTAFAVSNGIRSTGGMEISGGNVTATSTGNGTGILVSGDTEISDGKVTIFGGWGGIIVYDKAEHDNPENIIELGNLKISGGKVTASGDFSGLCTNQGSIEISGGKVTAIKKSDKYELSGGIYSMGDILLSLPADEPDDFIFATDFATDYSAPKTIAIKTGEIFTNGKDIFVGEIKNKEKLAGKKLRFQEGEIVPAKAPTASQAGNIDYVRAGENYYVLDENGNYVQKSLAEIRIRANQTFTVRMDSYTYDGTAHEPQIIGTAYGDIHYYYYTADANGNIQQKLSEPPTEAGNYVVEVFAYATEDHNYRIVKVPYSIREAVNYHLSVKNGTINDETSGEFIENSIITVKADKPATGKKFGYWTKNGSAEAISYNSSYTFKINSDTELEAIYLDADDEFKADGRCMKDSVDIDKKNKKISFSFLNNVPQNCTMVKCGVVATSDMEQANALSLDNAMYVKEYETDAYNCKYTWTKSNVTDGQAWYVKGYLIYKDKSGKETTVYSHMEKATLKGSQTILEEKILGTASMASVKSYKNTDTSKGTCIDFVSLLNVPADCKIKFAGIVATSDENKKENLTKITATERTDIDNCFVRGTASSKHTVQFTWTKTNVGKETWYVRPYLVYTDSLGREQTVYGELTTKKLS